MSKKYKKRKPRKKINKSIYKSNINKQHVKVNINTGSTPFGVSYMKAPAYPNLMDINSTIKGTMQDLLKHMSHHQAEPKAVINHNLLYNFENKNNNVSTLSQIAKENKAVNSFDNFDRGIL